MATVMIVIILIMKSCTSARHGHEPPAEAHLDLSHFCALIEAQGLLRPAGTSLAFALSRAGKPPTLTAEAPPAVDVQLGFAELLEALVRLADAGAGAGDEEEEPQTVAVGVDSAEQTERVAGVLLPRLHRLLSALCGVHKAVPPLQDRPSLAESAEGGDLPDSGNRESSTPVPGPDASELRRRPSMAEHLARRPSLGTSPAIPITRTR
ncbi:hypothetical protein T492DRAFT_843387 [Pavlovales sp. CCMP2436]|nr:hypothetical protein T492DRAFT_843387 [Pavlovales sp. CCMP2436]